MTAPEQEPIRLTPGNRYLVREGRWSHGFREIIVREESRTAVKVQYQSGTRIWHPRQEVERWVIVEDLGPVVERDPAQELRDAVREWLEAKDAFDPTGGEPDLTPRTESAAMGIAEFRMRRLVGMEDS